MAWIKKHIGFLLVVPVGIFLYLFPLWTGQMFLTHLRRFLILLAR